ncbi:MAG: glycosyltransferase family 4 protein [Anaerolineales bacterium]|nr:glycosyltransferase family 4 protein [Anaerolineales bacterium]
MKIAFATIGDARDVRWGSGTPFFLSRELIKQGHIVHFLGPLVVRLPFLTRVFKRLSRSAGKKYFSYRDPFIGRVLGRAVERKLVQLDYDVLLTNDFCLAGYTRTEKPIILYTDAIFPYNYSENVHPWLDNISVVGVIFCQLTTRRGMQNSDQCIFASYYGQSEAVKYKLPGVRSVVIPYGANIDPPLKANPRSIDRIYKKKVLDLLFIGKDWQLKGGDIAVKTTRILNEKGVKAALHVVGADLSDVYVEPYIRFYGLLNKDREAECVKLQELFELCDVLVVPSRAEGYGLVFVEAAAYGIPSLAYDTTGTKTSVGTNGVLFDISENEEAFVSQIQLWLEQPSLYQQYSNRALQNYHDKANWAQAIRQLVKEMSDALKLKQDAD